MPTKSEIVAADIAALLRSRKPIIWAVSREEARAEGFIMEAAASAGYVPRTWDCGQGIADVGGRVQRALTNGSAEIDDALRVIGERAAGGGERGAWILRDLPAWLSGAFGVKVTRQLRNLARTLPGTPRESAQAIIVLTTSAEVPPDLVNDVAIVDWPLPDRAEIGSILDGTIKRLPDDIREKAAPNGTREAAIDAAVGLSGEQAQSCFARSLVQLRRIDPALIAAEKKRVISASKALKWIDPLEGGLSAVGGLDLLKDWLVSRKSAFSAAFREYAPNVRPKGCLIAGVSGCGKTLIAQAIATAWTVPMMMWDPAAGKGRYVGESETNLRSDFRTMEAVGFCVVVIDEIDKKFDGSDGGTDGGVSRDQLGASLTWMQEREGDAFLIATANDITKLPPELIRRFEIVWFVDLPNRAERLEIILAALRTHKRDAKVFADTSELVQLAGAMADFTGAEIAKAVEDAFYPAFNDNRREVNIGDFMGAAAKVVPLARTASETIAKLQQMVKEGRARRATSEISDSKPDTAGQLDL